MIRSFLLAFFSLTIITSPFLFPGPGTATCDFGKTPITLKAVNKPVTEILKDIEKQTQYTIEVHNAKTLDNKKSIEVNQAPLNLTLNRLLKDLSYSIICNDEQKTLGLVFLDNSGPSSPTSRRTAANESQTNSMADLSAAFDDYRNNRRETPSSPQEDPEEMRGIESAMQDYKNNKNKNALSPLPSRQKTSMDAVTTALDEHKFNKQSVEDMSSPQEDINSDEMDDLTAAFEEFQQLDIAEQSLPQTENSTTMDGAETAMEEYKKQQQNN
ncbi:MAG: hypothetical protein KJ804_20580 [Proteobacteria bacterium]|nr:hypothetical protein [Pseudomonadota bacterium]MBU1060705.1 hypothetical protein [Pseudomonadota bacterium]